MAKLMFAYKISIGYPLIMLALFALIVILQNHLAYGKPYSPSVVLDLSKPLLKNLTDCDTKEDVLELCQRCAKKTKSEVVYPMCCINKEEAQDWCHQFLSFGLQ